MKNELPTKSSVYKTIDDLKRETPAAGYLPFSRTKKKDNSIAELLKHNHQSLENFEKARNQSLEADQSYGSRNRYGAVKLRSKKRDGARTQMKFFPRSNSNQGILSIV